MTDVTVILWGDRSDAINFGSSGDTVILTGSARLAATIRGQFGFAANTVIVAGEAAPGRGFGVPNTIRLRSLNGVGDNVVAVTGTGAVFAGPGGSAVALEGSGNLLQNAGRMVGGSGVAGIYWQDGSVENRGTIPGMRQAGAWLLEGGADNRILNRCSAAAATTPCSPGRGMAGCSAMPAATASMAGRATTPWPGHEAVTSS